MGKTKPRVRGWRVIGNRVEGYCSWAETWMKKGDRPNTWVQRIPGGCAWPEQKQ